MLPLEKVVGLQVHDETVQDSRIIEGLEMDIVSHDVKQIPDLVARKQSGENISIEDADLAFHQREYERLRTELQAAHDASPLPELPSDETRAALNDLLIRVRLMGRCL